MANEFAARKNSKMIIVGLVPDVCFTPGIPSPIPYQVVAFLGESQGTATSVHFSNDEAFIHNKSLVMRTMGDEPGSNGGVITGTTQGICTSIQHSTDTFIEGNQMVRVGDLFFMNG
ncbi:DUF4150 domain-containing protein [Pantoea agglomerans]|uniref:DUF4150 domain-containing protein n=1 Tax=Enterobacter agglomerans TaxID=549 RepID=UPI00301E08F8